VPQDDDSGSAGAPSDALLALTSEDLRAIAEDLVLALAANHAAVVSKARADQRWEAHLGAVIREAWSDYQACAGSAAESDEHFRAALNAILAEGRPVF
jgi:hypothetical protein